MKILKISEKFHELFRKTFGATSAPNHPELGCVSLPLGNAESRNLERTILRPYADPKPAIQFGTLLLLHCSYAPGQHAGRDLCRLDG